MTYRDDPALLTEGDARELDAFRRFLALGIAPGGTIPDAWRPYVLGTGPAPPPPETGATP